MEYKRIEITPSPVPNTKYFGIYKGDFLSRYEIVANEGYLLHNKARDYDEIDVETNERKTVLGYGETASSCPLDYDFSPVVVYDESGISYIGFGKFELFAKSKLI